MIKVITGNAAAAYGAMLSSPDVIAVYPITPQSEVIEKLAEFHADGELDAELITVEGENSAMNAVTAACVAGGRVFTATSSWGLAFMYDAVLAAAGTRAPVVMVNVNREPPGIIDVSSGQQDMITVRDCGWIFLIAEDCQEILDMVIMAYRLAEDFDIQVPVMVHYDGFYLSYLSEKVDIPSKDIVNKYLSVLKKQPEREKLMPGRPVGCGSHGILGGYIELRKKHCAALERAKNKLYNIEKEFFDIFGRSYTGQIEEYETEGADIILAASGSMCGTIKSVIDVKRKEGLKIGLVRLRMFRPFPSEKLIEVLRGRKAIGVVDRSICFGFKGGPFYNEIKSISQEIGECKILSFIDGIANTDVTKANIERIITILENAAHGEPVETVTWVTE